MVDRICSIDGCGKPIRCRNWCRNHYDRWLRHGNPLGGSPSPSPAPLDGRCSIVDCGGQHYGRGWCEKHYQRWKKHGDPLMVLPPAGGCPPGHPSHAVKVRPTGTAHPNWAGDGVGYVGLHQRVRSRRGRAALHECARVDATCSGPMHWANISHQYQGVDDFMPLCQSHHFRYDKESGAWGAAGRGR